MTNIISTERVRHLGDVKIPLVIEIHESLWLEDFTNYEIRDFLRGGKIDENPNILKGDPKVIECISRNYFQVQPFSRMTFENEHLLGGYIYLIDSPNGIQIYRRQEVKKTEDNSQNS